MAIFMVLSMAACGGGGETDTSSGESGQPVASAAGQGETLGEVESGSAEESASVSDPSTATVPSEEGSAKQEERPGASQAEPTGAPQAERLPSTKAEILALYTTVMNKAKAENPALKRWSIRKSQKKNLTVMLLTGF